jgi:AcrR family transcriptional regulator
MAQRKKDAVRDAILGAAFGLFSEKGYHETTIPAIARAAGISTANVYVYYRAKIDILFALYEPWLLERLDRLDRALRRITDKHRRLERLLLALWRDLPRESNGFANNVMQAVSASNGSGDYSPRLRKLFQERVAKWLIDCMDEPLSARDAGALAGVLLMAFDGFAINVHLAHGLACDVRLARNLAAVLAPIQRWESAGHD